MRRKTTSLLILAAALALPACALAQAVHWDPPGGSLPVGQLSRLQLVFDDCSPDDTPSPPRVDGLRLEADGQSSNISIINGTYSRNVTYTFAALLSRAQGVDIPEFTVNTNKGALKVPAAHFGSAGATVGSSGVSLGDAASAVLTPSQYSVWAGEVFDLRYSIDVAAAYYPSWGHATIDWDPTPLVTEEWSEPEPFQTHDSAPRTGLRYQTRAVAPSAGRISLNPTSQLVALSVGVSGFGFFQQRQYQTFAVPGAALALDVRALPPPPAKFTGAVGEFHMDSKIVPAHVKVGEPVTWTVNLSGTGNWPEIHGLPAREVPADFQTIQPKPKLAQPQGKLFEGTYSEDVVLVPTKAGSYELPPFDFVYFDPRSGSYRTVTAPGGTVIADPAAAPAAAPGSPPETAGPGATPAEPALAAKAPESPTSALGDPVPPQDAAPALLSWQTLLAACAVPFGLVLLAWAWLAYGRARLTDPLRPQREAKERLKGTVASIASAPRPEPALLLSWQRDSAVLCGVTGAAPQPAAFPPEWSTLWAEADRALYSTDTALPGDWAGRASTALGARTLRSFSLLSIFRLRNLVPMAAALAIASAALGSDPASAYRKGDFPAAEKAWSDAVAASPTDWSSRHNLSLALSQQDRWGEAAAEAAAAFVQNPCPETRRQLSVSGEKAGFIPEPFDALLEPGAMAALARMESPAAWQRALVAASALAALALLVAVLSAHGSLRRSWALPAWITFLALSVLLAGAAAEGYSAYGIAADSRAVVVWRAGMLRSIPTEANVPQKTSTLAAGSTAVVTRTFPGWLKLTFSNGETGWVPDEEVVYLWKAPPSS